VVINVCRRKYTAVRAVVLLLTHNEILIEFPCDDLNIALFYQSSLKTFMYAFHISVVELVLNFVHNRSVKHFCIKGAMKILLDLFCRVCFGC